MSKIRSDDKDFLERMDKAWRYLFVLAAALLSPVVTQLLVSFNMRVLAVFLILLGAIVLPFVVEIWGIISASTKVRFYSWTMLIVCIIATGLIYLYGGIWRVYLRPLLVPYVMELGDFILMIGIVDGAITYGSMRYSLGRLIRHFQANLKGKSYREQIPVFHDGMGWSFWLIFALYIWVEFFAVWYLLH